ncbi:DUF805 domain-containing protein [Pelomonas sp. HMWF004]|nr:DUF805 domain-containing protein [Pelomonas sp. HMWF004]
MNSPEVNQYAPPTATVADVAPATATAELNLFSAQGRIGRLRYLAYVTGAAVVQNIVTVMLTMALARSTAAFTLMALVALAALVWFNILCAIKRCHDLDISGWWTLTSVIPIIALAWVFMPGSKSENRFGPPPPPNTSGVRVLGLLMPAIFLIGILAAIAIPSYKNYTDRARAAQAASPR